MSTLFASGEGLTAAKLNAVDDRIIALEDAVFPSPWQNASVYGQFDGSVAGSALVGYRLEGYTVWFRGLLEWSPTTPGTALTTTTAFMTLPTTMRPTTTVRIRCGGFNNAVMYRFDISTAGVVSYVDESFTANPADGDRFMFDGESIPIG